MCTEQSCKRGVMTRRASRHVIPEWRLRWFPDLAGSPHQPTEGIRARPAREVTILFMIGRLQGTVEEENFTGKRLNLYHSRRSIRSLSWHREGTGQRSNFFLNDWQLVSPVVCTLSALVAVVEQDTHVLLVEGFRRLFREVRPDKCQIEADFVALGASVHLHHIVVAADGYHGGDRASRDAEGAPLHSRPFRVKPAIPDDVRRDPPDLSAALPFFAWAHAGRMCGRIKEELRHGAAVHMHLLVWLTVHRHVEHSRREGNGRGSGGE